MSFWLFSSILIIIFISLLMLLGRKKLTSVFLALNTTALVSFIISVINGFGEPLRVHAIEGQSLSLDSPWYKWLVSLLLLFLGIGWGIVFSIHWLCELIRNKLSKRSSSEKLVRCPVVQSRQPSYPPVSRAGGIWNFLKYNWKKLAILIGVDVIALVAVHGFFGGLRQCRKIIKQRRSGHV